MTDLVTHHVRRRRRPRSDDDLPVTVSARAGVPGRPAGRQLHPLQPAHVVEVGDTAGADVNRIQAGGQLLLDQQRKIGQPVDRGDRFRGRVRVRRPFADQHVLQAAAVTAARVGPVCPGGCVPGPGRDAAASRAADPAALPAAASLRGWCGVSQRSQPAGRTASRWPDASGAVLIAARAAAGRHQGRWPGRAAGRAAGSAGAGPSPPGLRACCRQEPGGEGVAGAALAAQGRPLEAGWPGSVPVAAGTRRPLC